MTRFFIVILCLICLGPLSSLHAQYKNLKITGKVVDQKSQEPIEFATVILKSLPKEKNLSGVTSDAQGNFELYTESPNILLEVSFIGYVNQTYRELDFQNGKLNLGTVYLKENSEVMDEIVIQAERSQTEFQLDKRVFNVGKDLTNSGASALEILNNVPSVNVNIEGEISLRGSAGVQVLINGKPSVLTSEQGNALGSITADMIEKVEVITNPSAKYDAEGTSGIINIVIKKEERKGTNGSFSLNTGIPDNHSVGLSLNRRTEKFNLFTQLGMGYRELPNDIDNINQDLINNNQIVSQGEEFRNETFYNINLGADYYLNPQNVFTLSGSFAYEVEDQPSSTNFQDLDGEGSLESQWFRSETTEATNPKWQYEFQYKRDFKDDEDHTLLFSALGSYFGKDQSSEFTDVTIQGSDQDAQQQTETEFKEAEYTIKLDYARPLSEKFSMETGGQIVLTDVSNDFAVRNLENGVFVLDSNFTNLFEYDQKVYAGYATGAYEGDRWGIKVGVRLEYTDLNTILQTTQETNSQNFTNLFPSAHTSYKFSDKFSIQAGYSRRIRRPRLWDLNPFFNIRNNFSIRTGNPALQPEFTDSYEINSIFDWTNLSLNFGVYHRYTTAVVERISTFENNVTTFRPENLGTNRSTGLELNGKYTPKDWFAVNWDFNFNYFQRKGASDVTSFDFSAEQWSTKWTAKFKLPADLDFEITGRYNSSFQTVQSEVASVMFADLGLRKKIIKGKGVLNFSVRDIFASRINKRETIQPDFFTSNRRQRGRFITMGFSYGFGKGEAMQYSGRRR